MDKGDHLECGSSISEMAEKNQYDLKLYRSVIRDIIEKIDDVKQLKRIYNLATYLHLKTDDN